MMIGKNMQIFVSNNGSYLPKAPWPSGTSGFLQEVRSPLWSEFRVCLVTIFCFVFFKLVFRMYLEIDVKYSI
jgi:hypothetical protein